MDNQNRGNGEFPTNNSNDNFNQSQQNNDDNPRANILSMLQEGKISVDEAMKLLKQFPEENQKSYKREDGIDFNDIGNKIKEGLSNAAEALSNLDINLDLSDIFSTVARFKKTELYISDPVPQNISSIKLLGKNSNVQIKGTSENCVKITCIYFSKQPEANVIINNENWNFEVLYDYNSVRSMQIICEVPYNHIEHINAQTKNSSIELDSVNFGDAELFTKNSSISIYNVNSNFIDAGTSNSYIKAKNIKSTEVKFTTSNSKIDVENVTTKVARLKTSNAKINVENSDVENLDVITSNSGVKIDCMYCGEHSGERSIDVKTSNGGIAVCIPKDSGVMLHASTNNGSIDCSLQNMHFKELSKKYAHGISQDYENMPKKYKVNLNTLNSGIKIKSDN